MKNGGIYPSANYDSTQFNIHNGEKIILYIDGLLAIRSNYNYRYGVEKLKQLIIANEHLKAREFSTGLINDALQWAGSKKHISDD
ncbi:MAG: SpoIIE family protein phosphatase [Spirochaetota bacterium]